MKSYYGRALDLLAEQSDIPLAVRIERLLHDVKREVEMLVIDDKHERRHREIVECLQKIAAAYDKGAR